MKDLIDRGKGFCKLKTKKYGNSFNLGKFEPYYEQPLAAGFLCSGFLVDVDIIATTSHYLKGHSVADLSIFFGFRMLGPFTLLIRIPDQYIYSGVKETFSKKECIA